MIGKEPEGSAVQSSLRRLRRFVSIIVIARVMPFMTSSCIFSRSSANIETNTNKDDAVTRQIFQANECGLDRLNAREVFANRYRRLSNRS